MTVDPSYEFAKQACSDMLTEYDMRSGPFASLRYVVWSDLVDDIPDISTRKYVTSKEVCHELADERLRLCVWRHQEAHWSSKYEAIKTNVQKLMFENGYSKPPFAINGKPNLDIKKVSSCAADMLAGRGADAIKIVDIEGRRNIIFELPTASFGKVRCTIEVRHRLDGLAQFFILGGGLQTLGYKISLRHEYTSGIIHYKIWGLEVAAKDLTYLNSSNYREEVENMIGVVLAMASFL